MHCKYWKTIFGSGTNARGIQVILYTTGNLPRYQIYIHKIFVNCLRSSSFFTGRHFEFERGEKERNPTFKQKRCTNIRRAHHSAKELKTYTKEEKGKKGKSRKNQNQKTKSAVSRKLVIRVKAFLFYTALKKDIEYPFPNC